MTPAQPFETLWRAPAPQRVVARGGRAIVVLDIAEVWAFEARDRLCFVHSARGRFDVDISLLEAEAVMGKAFLRVHRRWLANVANVRAFEAHRRSHALVVGSRVDGEMREMREMRIPVSRELASIVKQKLLAGTVGIHLRRSRPLDVAKGSA